MTHKKINKEEKLNHEAIKLQLKTSIYKLLDLLDSSETDNISDFMVFVAYPNKQTETEIKEDILTYQTYSSVFTTDLANLLTMFMKRIDIEENIIPKNNQLH